MTGCGTRNRRFALAKRIRELKSGDKWFVDMRLPNGTRIRKHVGTRKQAEEVEKKITAEIFEGKWGIHEKKNISFADLVVQYLRYAEDNKAASTFSADKCRIVSHLMPYFGNLMLNQITAQLVEAYKSMRIQDGASAKTINNELGNLGHMLNMAYRWGNVSENVVDRVEKMRVPKNPPRFLSKEEITALLDTARGYYIYPLLETALHTGMRKSELFNLTWSDVDFELGTVMVRSKADWHTKNYKSRALSITPKLRHVLLAHKEAQNGVSKYVFTYEGRKLHATIKKSLRTVVREAGLTNVTLHTLRHTFASHLVMAGVPLREVQELMGHASFETTLRYAHLSQDHVKRQVLRLPFAD